MYKGIVMPEKFININFPFKDSPKGFFFDLTKTDARAIKADLMHLILTQKGQRLYLPDFGTNLMKYIFEPHDNLTYSDIRQEINDVVSKYLPNLQIDEVVIERSEASEYAATLRIDYTVTEDVFESKDFVLIQI